MIKWIKNIFCKIIGIKQCKCPEDMDPHEVMLHLKKSDVPVYENEDAVKAEHCSSHNRFRKSCSACQEIIA